MQTNTFTARLAKVAAAASVAAVGAASLIAGTTTAGADPKQFEDPLITMGSDTTQDILDAFTGEVNGQLFHPLRSASQVSGAGVETGQKQIASFRAVNLDANGVPEDCVDLPGGIQVDRPNGSGNGRRALTAAFATDASGNPVGWGRQDVNCTGVYDAMAGQIHFSRSSSGASGTTGDLTFVPFGRDALQFAYSAPDAASAVSNLTTQQVQDLHTNAGGSAVLNVGGTRVIACRIQDGSGTYESWFEDMFGTEPNESDELTLETSTGECAAAFDSIQQGIDGIQEHDPQGLYDVCERIRNGFDSVPAQPTTQCIIGYSVANWVAQFNGVGSRSLDVDGAGTDAPPAAATGGAFNIGTRDGGAAAYAISGGTASPNPAYYADATFGRDVYNVVPTTVISLPGNLALKTMLLGDGPDTNTDPDFNHAGPGSGPAICSPDADATRNLFGFGEPVDHPCGAFGGFLKRAWDFTNTGPIGTPESS